MPDLATNFVYASPEIWTRDYNNLTPSIQQITVLL